jgi:hypothetical protein
MPDRMTTDEAVEVLKIASAYDGRQPSVLQATVWAADLGDAGVDVTTAAQALRRFYLDRPDDYVKPGHVIAIARKAARERAEQAAVRVALDAPDRVQRDEAGMVKIRQLIADAKARLAAETAAARGPDPFCKCPDPACRMHEPQGTR